MRIQAEGIEEEVREVISNDSSRFFDLDESARILNLVLPLSTLDDGFCVESTF